MGVRILPLLLHCTAQYAIVETIQYLLPPPLHLGVQHIEQSSHFDIVYCSARCGLHSHCRLVLQTSFHRAVPSQVKYTMAQHSRIQYQAVQRSAVQCVAVQNGTKQHTTVQHCTVHYLVRRPCTYG